MADAELTVGADASAVERAAAAGKAAWKDFGESIKESIGSATRTVVSGLSEVALAQGKVNFSAQHAQVREFEASTARMAVAARRDLEGVRAEIEQTGVAIGKRPQEVTAWSGEVERLTYHIGGATDAIRGMSELAADTGRTVEDYRGLAVELGIVGHVAGDTTRAVGVLRAQSDELGNAGGVAAFTDQIEGLGDVISRFAVNSERDFLRVTALAGVLGQGLSPQAAQRVQQGALGAIAGDPLRWERFLGHSIQDEHGQVADPSKVMQEMRAKVLGRYGVDARRVLQLNFGAETGAAIYNADFGKAAELSGLAPSGAPSAAQRALLGTDAGQRSVASAELAVSSRALLGSSTMLGRAADSLERFAAHNPIASTFASTAVGAGIASFLAKQTGAGGLIETLTPGVSTIRGAGSQGGALMAGLGSAAAVVGAGVAGYQAGTALDEALGISDWISGTSTGTGTSRNKEAANERFATDVAGAQGRIAAIRRTNAALRGVAGLSPEELGAGRTAAQAVVQSNAALATGGEGAMAALVGELKREGVSDAGADKIARAVVEGMQKVKLEVRNTSGGPVEVTAQGGHSAAAGNQSHP